jgi:hypothetical protein
MRGGPSNLALSQIIEQKLNRIFELANSPYAQHPFSAAIEKHNLNPIEKQTFQTLANTFGISVYIGKHNYPRVRFLMSRRSTCRVRFLNGLTGPFQIKRRSASDGNNGCPRIEWMGTYWEIRELKTTHSYRDIVKWM